MDCHQFDQIVVELARGGGAEAGSPPGAVDHARSCPRCAAHLSDQRKLAAALRSVNAAVWNQEAPLRVEHSLLRAFRARFDASGAATTVEAASPRRKGAFAWRVWTIAAAAVLLLGFVVVWKLQPTSPARLSDRSGWRRPLDLRNPWKSRPNPASRLSERASSPQVMNKKAAAATVGNSETHSALAVVHNAVSRPRRTAKNGTPSKLAATPDETATIEMTTRFYPLPYGSGLGLDEGWGLVRVEVPRASLESLGLPVSAGSASSEMLTADVVVGQDGLARGIRFMQ